MVVKWYEALFSYSVIYIFRTHGQAAARLFIARKLPGAEYTN